MTGTFTVLRQLSRLGMSTRAAIPSTRSKNVRVGRSLPTALDILELGKIQDGMPRGPTSASFNFRGSPTSRRKVEPMLSGGERKPRPTWPKMLKSLALNVLLLDEPTNDLDTEDTLGALEEALEQLPGLRR
jgi:ATPase subunit of ABC transporter with duplicated ATPase domains